MIEYRLKIINQTEIQASIFKLKQWEIVNLSNCILCRRINFMILFNKLNFNEKIIFV